MNFMEKITKEQLVELQSAVRTINDTRAVLKIQAIILIENKLPADTLQLLTGYKRAVAVRFRKAYIKQGIDALRTKSKRKNFKALLTRGQRDEIVIMLNTKKPSEFGHNQDFWTTKILAAVIEKKWGVHYKSRSSMYLFFKEAKFTFRKPEKKSEKHNPEAIEAWKKEYEPIIKEECAKEDTIVLTGDELVLTSETRTQRVWLPVNVPAFVENTTKRKTVHLYGFLDVVSGAACAFKTEEQTGETTVSILKKLATKYHDKRIVIFWDNASWHKSSAVRDFLGITQQFKLYNFPPYAPELNPQEHVWKEMRDKTLNNKLITDIKAAANDAISFIENTIFQYKF